MLQDVFSYIIPFLNFIHTFSMNYNLFLNFTKIFNRSLHYGLYNSLYEWFNPIYLSDKKAGFKTQDYVAKKAMPELIECL